MGWYASVAVALLLAAPASGVQLPRGTVHVSVVAEIEEALAGSRAGVEKLAPELLAVFHADADAIVEPVDPGVLLEFRDTTSAAALAAVARIPGFVSARVVDVPSPLRLDDWLVRIPESGFVPPNGIKVTRASWTGLYVRVRAEAVDRGPYRPNWDLIWDLAATSATWIEPNALFRGTARAEPFGPAQPVGGLPTAGPNDPDHADAQKRWHLDHAGAPGAWTRSTDCELVVAVLDTGIEYCHPDLAANRWINDDEVPGDEDDDDQNGFDDDLHGWDFWDEDDEPLDGHGHGTHIAGIIGAVGNNGIGSTGLCWKVRLMPVRIYPNLLEDAGGDLIADAVYYAIENGASILNCSFGGKSKSDALELAFQEARDKGVLVVTSAGNGPLPIDVVPFYPPWYELDNIVTVASITGASWNYGTEDFSTTSNYGVEKVDLGAPGIQIWTTGIGHVHEWAKGGTSLSAAVVSGAAALVWDEAGGKYADVIACLEQNVKPRDYLANACAWKGSVDVTNACASAQEQEDFPPVVEPITLPKPPIVIVLPPPVDTLEGVLRTGVFAAGGETTGTVLRRDEGDVELELVTPEQVEAAAKLDGRSVRVVGELVVVEGLERGPRRVLRVNTLAER